MLRLLLMLIDGSVIFFTLIKFMKILSGTHFFEMTKGTYFKAGYALLANVLFIFVVYFGFVHVARILFHRTADFSDLMRSADMVMGFCAASSSFQSWMVFGFLGTYNQLHFDEYFGSHFRKFISRK